MANTLGVYNPIFFAQEALIQLEAAMGLANRVFMGFDEERRAFGYGETINIRRPSTFTAQDAPSVAQDINTGTVAITLNRWKEVKFALTDRELAFTRERIIRDHIRPAAVALANDVDQFIAGLFVNVPWQVTVSNPATVADITKVRQVMFDNKVPLIDPSMMHFMVNGKMEAELLSLQAFAQQQGAGDLGVNTQTRGNLGMKYGYNFFANQNVRSHTAGTGTITDAAVNKVGGYAAAPQAETSTIAIDATAITTGTLKKGDTLKFAGHSQHYVLTEDPTFTANAGNITISPGLQAPLVDNEAITFYRVSGAQALAFHRNFAALVTAPLSELGNGRGAEIAVVQDPVTGLSLRSRIYYDGDNSKLNVALDILYGGRVLDGNLACRAVVTNS